MTMAGGALDAGDSPHPDMEEIWRYLSLLDPSTTEFTFQTFDDNKDRKDRRLAHIAHGPLPEDIAEIQAKGAGFFVTVNQTDGTGRSNDAITRVRSVWCEIDGKLPDSFPIPPSMVVQSSNGKHHCYWLIIDEWPADEQGRTDFAGVMRRMVQDYGSDAAATDIARVLRLPGTWHLKGRPQLVRIIDDNGANYTRAEILAAFPPIAVEERAAVSVPPGGALLHDDLERIRSALQAVPSDDRDIWVKVGMGLKAELGDAGFGIWRDWSATSIKFDDADTRHKWKSFKKEGVGIASVFKMAQDRGWRPPASRGAQVLERIAQSAARRGQQGQSSAVGDGAEPAAGGDAPAAGEGALEFDDEIELDTKVTALVKGVLHPGEIGAIYGPSGVGKSFAAVDLSYHLAHGLAWHGRKIPAKAAVLLVALEGVRGMRHRMYGYAGYLGNAGKMLARLTIHTPLDRSETGAAGEAAIIANAASLAEQAGQPVGLIVIDTLARAIAGDDENSTQDMNAFVTRISAIARATGSAVLVVHHTGKDDARGMRGSSTLFAACDLVMRISDQGGAKLVTAEKVKDGETGTLFAYSLDRKVLGYDDDNEEITTCVVKRTDVPAAGADEKLTPNQATMLAILRSAKRSLTTDEWYEMTRTSGVGRNRHATLFDVREQLRKKGLVYEGIKGWNAK